MSMLFPELEPMLLISIKKEHLESIFNGAKKFELRKLLPKDPFSKIIFYETESVGIVGFCDVTRVIEGAPSYVWSLVGEAATTKLRFNNYFKDRTKAYAVEVSNPVRFIEPITPKLLREYIKNFTAPQSYLLIRPEHPLFALLRNEPPIHLKANYSLRAPSAAELLEFKKLVEIEIGPKYPDTGMGFARFIESIHKSGNDKNGFLTIDKEIVAISNNHNNLMGFSVLTRKRGRAVKTGPTVLFDEYRGKGYGREIRLAIENKIVSMGASKAYCTCPASDRRIVSHLLGCGYRIEAFLERHYSGNENELVFSKELTDSIQSSYMLHRVHSRPGKIAFSLNEGAGRKFVALLKLAGLDVPLEAAKRIIQDAKINDNLCNYNEKPRKIIWLTANEEAVGLSLLAFKRGGAIRGVLAVNTAHTPSIDKLIYCSIDFAVKAGKRKLYFMHPIRDSLVVGRFDFHGFMCEGILRGPYKIGVDLGIFSKFI